MGQWVKGPALTPFAPSPVSFSWDSYSQRKTWGMRFIYLLSHRLCVGLAHKAAHCSDHSLKKGNRSPNPRTANIAQTHCGMPHSPMWAQRDSATSGNPPSHSLPRSRLPTVNSPLHLIAVGVRFFYLIYGMSYYPSYMLT